MLPHQQRIIGSATYRHAKYAWQYVDVGKTRRDKTQIYALGYSIDGLDITCARTDSNQALAKTIPKPACCRRHGHLTNSPATGGYWHSRPKGLPASRQSAVAGWVRRKGMVPPPEKASKFFCFVVT